MVTNLVFYYKLNRLYYVCHQEEDYTDTLYLKSARQVVLTRERCLNYLPYLHKGYLCATGDNQHPEEYGYAAV